MSDRRNFLVGAGASILVASALTERAQARIQTGNLPSGIYTVGLVSNRDLAGLSGQLLLNVYLAVEDGMGFGTISDPVHPQVNSHVEIRDTRRHGNELQFDGEVILSNDPERVGQQVLVSATVHDDATSLVLELGGETFHGPGLTVGPFTSNSSLQNVVATVPMTPSTIAAVQGRAITLANGQVFGGPLGSNPATLIFTTPTTFTLTTSGVALAGNVTYGSGGSWTFVVTQGGGGALAVVTCTLVVKARNVVVGTGQQSGIITLVLNNNQGITVSSNSLTATVFLNGSGELFVVNPVTGVSVDMGIQP